jgi:peptidoglycan/LPS O-acetylase OafA/YrhL
MQIKKNNRLEYLDSARGLAAIFVVWGHFIFQYGMQDKYGIVAFTPLRFFYNAIPSVSFFFVLSGMVLSYKYFSKNLAINYKEYIIARFFRIYPAFIAVLLLSFLIQHFLYKQIISTPPMAEGRDFWATAVGIKNLIEEGILFSRLDGSSELVSQRWSLIVEIQISLLVPVMILITQRSIYWLLAFVCCIIIFFHEAFPAVYFLHFGLGILIALENKEIAAKWLTLSFIKKILLFITGALLYNYRYMVPHWQHELIPNESLSVITNNEFIIKICEGIGATIILITLVGSLSFQKILNHRYLTFIGKISYSIYLCHFIVLFTITPYCIHLLNNAGISNMLLVLFIALTVTTGFVIALSTILYYVAEKPFIKYGKIVATKISNRLMNKA